MEGNHSREVRWEANNYRWLKIISISPITRERLRPRTCAILNVDHTRYNYNLTSIALQQHWTSSENVWRSFDVFFLSAEDDLLHAIATNVIYNTMKEQPPCTSLCFAKWRERRAKKRYIWLKSLWLWLLNVFFSSPRRALRQLAEVEKKRTARRARKSFAVSVFSWRSASLVADSRFVLSPYNYYWKHTKSRVEKL